MSLRKTYKTDREKETEGVWQDVAINDHNKRPIRIKISRISSGNKRYTKELDRVTRPHKSAIQNDALDEDLARRMLQEVFVDTILLDWDNLPKSELSGNDEDTELLPFTRENALALFDEMPDLYSDWESRANQVSTFRQAELEKTAKNSSKS